MDKVTVGLNMAVKNFQVRVLKEINNSGLPASVSCLVLKDILGELERVRDAAVNKEIEEYEKKVKERKGEADA